MLEIIADILAQVNKMMTHHGFYRTAAFIILAILAVRAPEILQIILHK